MLRNVADGTLHAVHDADGQHIVQKFRVELRVRRDAFWHNRAVDEQDLGRIADGWAARFRVFDDIERHIKIGALVDIDMADARAGLDARHGRMLDACADEARSAARDEQVNIARGCHESGGPCV